MPPNRSCAKGTSVSPVMMDSVPQSCRGNQGCGLQLRRCRASPLALLLPLMSRQGSGVTAWCHQSVHPCRNTPCENCGQDRGAQGERPIAWPGCGSATGFWGVRVVLKGGSSRAQATPTRWISHGREAQWESQGACSHMPAVTGITKGWNSSPPSSPLS